MLDNEPDNNQSTSEQPAAEAAPPASSAPSRGQSACRPSVHRPGRATDRAGAPRSGRCA